MSKWKQKRHDGTVDVAQQVEYIITDNWVYGRETFERRIDKIYFHTNKHNRSYNISLHYKNVVEYSDKVYRYDVLRYNAERKKGYNPFFIFPSNKTK